MTVLRRTAEGTRAALPRTLRAGAALAGLALVLSSVGTAGATGSAGSGGKERTQAKHALLVRSDLPKGWTGSAGSGNNNDLPDVPQVAACIGVPPTLLDENPPQVYSPNFTSKDQTIEVDDIVTIYPSASDAKAHFLAMANPKTPGCLNQLAAADSSYFFGTPPKGSSIGTISVTAAQDPIPGTAAFTVSVPVTQSRTSLTVTWTEVVFEHGRLGQQVTFWGFGPTFPPKLENHIVAVAQHRL